MEYVLDEQLTVGVQHSPAVERYTLRILRSHEVNPVLEGMGINYEGDLNLGDIQFNKAEAEQDFFVGSLAIPKSSDVHGNRFRMMFFVFGATVVLVNDDGYCRELMTRMRRRHPQQNETKERFLSRLLSEMIARDAAWLDTVQDRLIDMEDEALHHTPDEFPAQIQEIRKQLLTWRTYYQQLADMGKTLEENENGVFRKKHVKYFGTFSDRAERLYQRTLALIDYANQVKDVYQSKVAEQQNKNMQYLTVISTVFLPLTFLTGWFGMNFQNMPGLASGYPLVVVGSVLVVVLSIVLFKIKKIL